VTAAPDHASLDGTFRNPLHDRVLADPFVLKFNGCYYAYGTPPHGEALPVLRSTDLVHWSPAGAVLGPPRAPGLAHWAPEVAYENGRFFLYHSTGGAEGEGQQVRVRAGESPTGPFPEDLGVLDTEDPFTIDPHPFRDDDGEWYLFYCHDFLEGEPVGTGIVVDRLVDMTRLGGDRTTVMRPHAEWHLYERNRRWYDRVWDWYTVEGPFVRKHDGRYWCFYSGGAWRAENYGISSAVADHPLGPFEPVSAEDTADVLRTVGGRVLGPGHGSVAMAPDNVTEYLVYHAWDEAQTGRYMCADPLVWTGRRPTSPGPRTEAQPLPPLPAFRDLFDDHGGPSDLASWDLEGTWEPTGSQLLGDGGGGTASAVIPVHAPASFLLEVNVAGRGPAPPATAHGVLLRTEDVGGFTAVLVHPHDRSLRWRTVAPDGTTSGGELARLQPDLRPEAYRQLLLRREGGTVGVTLDGVPSGEVPGMVDARAIGLVTTVGAAAFAGVTLSDLSAPRRQV
jgi:GH43 family beta-xylosidase